MFPRSENSTAAAPAADKTMEGNVTAPTNGSHSRSFLRDVILICSVTLCMIVNIANLSGVGIALPTIGRDLDIVEYKLQWITNAYSLSSGCLLLFFGRMADLYGRKRCFLCGCAWMGIFALGCGFAQNEATLDVLRGIQGLGAAAALPACLGILAHTFPPSLIRSVAFATFAAGAPVGGALGSAIGGVLTQLTAQSWRSMFWFLTGLAALCLIGGAFSVDRDKPYELDDRRIDWLGAFLATTGLTLIVFVLSDGSIAPEGWKTGYIIALLVVGVFLMVLFVLWERYLEGLQDKSSAQHQWWTPPPLMNVSIWTRASGKLGVMLIIAFLQYGGFQCFSFWIQLYYQNYVGLSPILTMVRLIPMFVTGCLCNLLVALVVGRISLMILIVIGTTLTGVANLLFAVIDPDAPYWAFGFPAAILAVFGADFVFAAGTLFVAKVCLPHEQSVGGALFNTLTQVGATFGTTISTIAFNTALKNRSRRDGVAVNMSELNAPRAAQLVAYKDAMWTGFAFPLFGALLAVLFLRGVGIVGHKEVAGGDEEVNTTGVTTSEKQQID
ncbi:efflux transporter [Trametes polyzona]|nr:efflux transporter [Trametes polyzona]